MNLLEDAHSLQDGLARLRHTLHRAPETGLDLPRTQETVLGAIDGLGLEVSLGGGVSSVTAVLRGARPGPTVLLRGDMDALPVAERTGLDFASENGNMHACGHDLHTAMLAGSARLLAQHRDRLAGDVVFMFQPGEEGFDGARHMVAEGVLDASGRRAEAAYAIHVMSAGTERGRFTTRGGPTMAASNILTVTVRGAGGHGSMPYRAKDPVPAACEMVTALQTWISRSFDIFDPVVLTVGMFHAGTQQNIIPDSATFSATVRSFSPAAQALVKDGTVRVCRGIAAAHGLEVDAEFRELYPVTVNDAAEAAFVARTVAELHGEERFLAMPQPLAGSEDFSRVLDEVPGAMIILGAAPDGADPATAPNNHSPLATFDDSVLADGAALYARLAVDRLALDETVADRLAVDAIAAKAADGVAGE
ncbi:M20 metallopeptidase family protein [Streptomyces sp. H27-D2]|uniref:M20 metallopeptidase family protein n=1 Tax=Streptomyces sp. H27-D2 TaxID=3046304 RepID=UPI002DB67731|nr:M20 family metallopeptidase [Streptomyces sp. H27-D2]MEC4015296.1 M20 family metallopeptidase [Streptomyces sp. H27-D2]